MAETAGDIIKDALAELVAFAQEQSVPAVDMNTGIRYLNRMMAAWSVKGISLGYTEVNTMNDPITVPAGASEGIVFNLAVRMAHGFDVPVGAELANNASESMKAVRILGINPGKMNFSGNLPYGSGNEGTGGAYDTQGFFPDCCEDQNEC